MIRPMALRVGIPVLVLWVVAILIGHPYVLIGSGVITLVVLGLVVWAYRYMVKNRNVANLLQKADITTASGRKEVLEQLETQTKKGDAAGLFAKAQVLMHEDPRKALEVLEQINLSKVMAPVADEARGQRAMIHLLLGEVDRARVLVDAIDLSRHDQTKSRAALAAVVAEAWARSAQGKRAVETLDLYDPETPELQEVKPHLYRSRAFAFAAMSDVKRMRHAMRKLQQINPQLLAGFLQKKVHPLLERQAKQMLMQSGAVPKKVVRRRV